MSQHSAWHESMELAATPVLPTAWAFGPYHKGMGGASTHYRERYACSAIKRELAGEGYDLDPTTPVIGVKADAAIRDFQSASGLPADGQAGSATCSALFGRRIFDVEDRYGIPRHWLSAHGWWESGAMDPGAELVNGDGSRDRGLFQDNDLHGPYKLSDAEAFDPAISVPARAKAMAAFAAGRLHEFCLIQDTRAVRRFWAWPISVSSFRTPVGAGQLVDQGSTEVVTPMRPPDQPGYPDDIDWEQAAAYYILRIDGVRRDHFA